MHRKAIAPKTKVIQSKQRKNMDVGLLGLGAMGRRHLKALIKLDTRRIFIFDQNREVLNSVMRDFPNRNIVPCESFELMLQDHKIDAMVVATTAPSHFSYVCKSAEAGVRYILCEKPMAVSVSQCLGMIEACARHEAILAVNHLNRFMPHYGKVYEFVHSKDIGELRSMAVTASNMGLAMNGSHAIEMFQFFTGEKIEKLCFIANETVLTNPRGENYKDLSGTFLGFSSNGSRLFMDLGNDLGHGVTITFGFSRGQIWLNDLSGVVRVEARQKRYNQLPSERYGSPAKVDIFDFPSLSLEAALEKMWAKVLSGHGFPCGINGLHTVQVLAAAYQSREHPLKWLEVEDLEFSAECFPWA